MVEPAMPLALASPGATVRIVSIKAGWRLTRRLADMGMIPGTDVRVVSSNMPGPVVVEVRGTRLALGHGMAQRIMVTG